MTGRTLVAGVGNIFQRDDAFGVEVIRLLAGRPRPDGVKVADFGIRGVHLVYELLDGCDLFVLVDAAQRGCEPGTVTVLEVEPDHMPTPNGVMDAHGLAPDQVFAMLASMGGPPGPKPRRRVRAGRREPGYGTVRPGTGGLACGGPRSGGNP